MAIDWRAASPLLKAWLTPNQTAYQQPFEYYAAHFLLGSNLTSGDIERNVRSLASTLRHHFEQGVEAGRKEKT